MSETQSTPFSGVKYKVNTEQWITDMNVPAHVTTVAEFITYLQTADSNSFSLIGDDSTVNVNVNPVNRQESLGPIRPGAGDTDPDGQLCFVAFNRNSKRGG
jgi:hypothetical protein